MTSPLRTARLLLLSVALLDAPASGQEIENHLRLHLEGVRAGEQVTVDGELLQAGEVLLSIYERRGWQPIWSTEGALGPAAQELFSMLAEIPSHGLTVGAYHELALRGATLAPLPVTAARLADLDLLLSDAYLRFGSDLAAGRVEPESFESDWVPTRLDFDAEKLLSRVGPGAPLAQRLRELLPLDPGYDRLRAALQRYRAIVASGGWPTEFPDVASGSPPMALIRRLSIGGDLAIEGQVAPDEVEAAVRRFQRRHGLMTTGALDEATLAELAVPAEERVRQILLNLERWRWLPIDLGRPHVRVDIPDSTLQLVGDGEPLTMKVIVGRSYRRTPVFSDRIAYLVLNPTWHIPRGIAVRDKLPIIRRDPAYLERQRIRVFTGEGADAVEVDPTTVDWAALDADHFPYHLRQEPGPLNALGRIKFMFPNRFNVYLHDTPDRQLFERQEREASSGCIRLERPIELAERLLARQGEWDRGRIEAVLESGRETTVALKSEVPVHLLYFTASVDEDGTVNFRRDSYGRDLRLEQALERAR